MKRWYMVIDVETCENCNNCFLACKDEHCDNDWPGFAAPQPLHGQRWMNIRRKERGKFPVIDVAYLPSPCMHCDDPPCLRAAENDAVVKRPDGIVLIDPHKARGQKALVQACPYGAIWWNEEEQIPQKCTLCAHLLDAGWKQPRCAQACPTGALTVQFLEAQEMQKLADDQGLAVIDRGEPPARPSVYYRNLYRFQTCFIAGSLARKSDGQSDCVADATVRLFKNGALVEKTVSDDFGDFKFDGLSPRSGEYSIEIECQDQARKAIEVQVEGNESCSVGTIWI
jgi:Fe-S-cluster-containing dehydrogenase component